MVELEVKLLSASGLGFIILKSTEVKTKTFEMAINMFSESEELA